MADGTKIEWPDATVNAVKPVHRPMNTSSQGRPQMPRKPATTKYRLLPEHEARFPEWRDRWIANAMSTAAMTEAEREACVAAVHGLYAAANLPPPKHVVFVPSPFVLAFAGGFSAARWLAAKNGHMDVFKATYAATREATYAATREATYAATYAATNAATYAATNAATDAATRKATGALADAATDGATAADYSRWYVVPGDLRRCADELGVGDFGLQCAARVFNMWQGGNQWAGYDAYLSFFQDIAQLPLDYTAYNHWRTLAERSGPRIVHPDFCMISDRPAVLKVDEQNRPHCEDGPFCAWRDGSELYSWHGVRLPARWVRERTTIDPAEILKARNVETRAAGAACIGWPRMLSALDYKIIDADPEPSHGELIELELEGLPEPGRFLKAECPRNAMICEGLPRVSDIDGLPINTVKAAQAWRMGLRADEFDFPAVRT